MLPTIFIVMGCSLVAFATGAAVFGLAVRRAIHSSARAEILRWSIVLFAALLSYFAGLFFITGGVHWVSTFPALLTGYIALNSIHRITSAPIVIEA